MTAKQLLLSEREVQAALGPHVSISEAPEPGEPLLGQLVKAAAADSAFRRFTGTLHSDDETSPVVVSTVVLVFDASFKAERTFESVAQAAHLRTEVEGCQVAVETVTTPSALVSYWGFLLKGGSIIILTLDTVNPQALSVSDLRSLVTLVAAKM